MMEYPKIQTLWKRDQFTKKIIEGDFSVKEFGEVEDWDVTEKVDGTNIRIICSYGEEGPNVSFKGRTEKSQIQNNLLRFLKEKFTVDHLFSKILIRKGQTCTLFGEGYGGNIQKCGHLYKKDVGFMIFDVFHDNWKDRKTTELYAGVLETPCVPLIGTMSLKDAVEYVKSRPLSMCSDKKQEIEGIVCKANSLWNCFESLVWKLKVRDFDK